MRSNQKGQSIVEACLGALTLALFLKLLLIALYSGFASLWLGHRAYELALCESSYKEGAVDCQYEFRRKLKGLLKFGDLKALSVEKTPRQISVRTEFRVINSLILSKTQVVSLPLGD